MFGAYILIIFISSSLIIWTLCGVLLCLFSCSLFQSLFYLIWVLLHLLYFGLHLHEIFFPSTSLSLCKCLLVWGGSLVDSMYRDLVFVAILQHFLCHLSIPLPILLSNHLSVFFFGAVCGNLETSLCISLSISASLPISSEPCLFTTIFFGHKLYKHGYIPFFFFFFGVFVCLFVLFFVSLSQSCSFLIDV